jgi:hypothetical protein
MAVEFYIKVTREIAWSTVRARAHAILAEKLVGASEDVSFEAVGADPDALQIGPAALDMQVRVGADARVELSCAWIPEDPAEPLDSGWSLNLAIWRTDESFLAGMVLAAALGELMSSPIIDDSALLSGPRLRDPREVIALIRPSASLHASASATRRALRAGTAGES